ncbi:uncharacterized protein [Porites lutea]
MGHRMKFLKLLGTLKQNKANSTSGDFTTHTAAASTTHTAATNQPDHETQVVTIAGDVAAESSQSKEPETAQNARKRPCVSVAQTDTGTIVLNAKLPWPATIDLPTSYRPEVTKLLQDKDRTKLTRKLRKSFVSRIYEHFSRYTLYPTKQQLLEISQVIIKTFPFLKDTSVGTGYDSWFAQLYDKFRNERKGITDDPEVILHKRRKTKGSEVQPVALKLRRGGINWEPPFPEGEDEVSLKRHKEWLQNECMRRTPDLKRVAERMSLTFPDRRRLMNKNVPLTEVRAEYPALFDFKQIVTEFERILGINTSILDTFQSNLSQVADQIIELGRARKGRKNCLGMEQYLQLLEGEFNDDDETENLTEEKEEVAMAVLPFLLKQTSKGGQSQQQDFVHFIADVNSTTAKSVALQSSFPFIIFEGSLDSPGQIHLAADKQLLCSFTGSLVEAACGLLASYYVFMFNYPVGLKNLFLYLQKCVLHINDAQKLPGSVISLVNDLDSLSKCN